MKLEKSGSHLRTGEWVLGVAATTLVLASLGLLRGGVVVIVLMFIFVPVVAWFLLNRKIQKRQDAFADQLPDLLQTLSSSLRSGQSLPQSIAGMAPDMSSPAGDELRRVVIENRIGRDLIESFKDLAIRMDSLDFDWVVRAIEINYRTGGDLSVILRRLDATIRARNQVAGAVRALTAEGTHLGHRAYRAAARPDACRAIPQSGVLGADVRNTRRPTRAHHRRHPAARWFDLALTYGEVQVLMFLLFLSCALMGGSVAMFVYLLLMRGVSEMAVDTTDPADYVTMPTDTSRPITNDSGSSNLHEVLLARSPLRTCCAATG